MEHHCIQVAEVAGLKSDVKTIFKRMDDQMSMSNAISELTAELRVMNERITNMAADQKRTREEVEKLKGAPKKRWDGIIQTMISAVVGGLVAYVFVQLGLK